MSSLPPDDTILGLLAVRARHGYEILDCFNDPGQLGEVWQISTSQVYAVLKRLEAQGLTCGYERTAADAPTRTEYRLTSTGELRLALWLNEPAPSSSIHRVRVEFLSRLYIARLLNVPTVPIVERQKAACQQQKTHTVNRLKHALPGIGRLTLELVISQLDAVLLWLDRCELVPHAPDRRESTPELQL